MLKELFWVESAICFLYSARVAIMISTAIEVNLIKLKAVRDIIIRNLSWGIYHFIVCLVLWYSIR